MPVFRVSLKVVGILESYNGVWPPKLLFTQILDHRRPRNLCFWGYVDLYCLPVCCACLALVAEAKKMQSLFSKLQYYGIPIVFFFGKGQNFLRCLRIPKWCLESSALMLSKFIQILLFIMTMCIHGLRFSAELNTFFFFLKNIYFQPEYGNSYLNTISELSSIQFGVSECQSFLAETASKLCVCMTCMFCVTGWLHKNWWKEAGRGNEGWSQFCKQILPESFQGCL